MDMTVGTDGSKEVSHMLMFLVGALLGVILGGTLCVGYLRKEITADIGPRLKRVQFQLDNLEAALNLAITTRYAELITQPAVDPLARSQSARPLAKPSEKGHFRQLNVWRKWPFG